jgi:hypothetical protein
MMFSGTDARVGTTGTMVLAGPLSVPGNLDLRANNGMVIEQNVGAGGDLFLSSGAGDMGIFGVAVSGHNVGLAGRSIFVGSTTGTAPTSVQASHLVKATTTVNFNVIGGANSSATSVVRGEDVDLTVGGVVNISGGSAYAQIESLSSTTTMLTFPNRSSGGFFVNGNENVISDGNTGFFANGQPAVLGQSLKVSYAAAIPPEVQQVNDLNTSAMNNLTDNDGPQDDDDKSLTVTDATQPDGEKDGKSLPVCK